MTGSPTHTGKEANIFIHILFFLKANFLENLQKYTPKEKESLHAQWTLDKVQNTFNGTCAG